ncbi:hypothetical protein F5Y05DRAFT_418326 [Hypoxylon sp. FL0543]|nr:hypothetical protein F5Y05DRAFT_418326 [Hypoxylon sp. FL0543]
MSTRCPSSSNSQSVNGSKSQTYTTKERFLNSKETIAPMYTENMDHISQCCLSHWHTHAAGTAPRSSDGWSNSPAMSPAPLRIPSYKASNPIEPESQNLPPDVSSQYSFPLPPANITKSRSRLPPPYSSLAPPISTPSTKETGSANGTSVAVNKSAHAVRPTQSATDIQKSARCKPLPAQPTVDVKDEPEEIKRWKPKIFRLTPASTGSPGKCLSSPGDAVLVAETNCGKGALPRTANTPKEPSPTTSTIKRKAQLHKEVRQQAKEKGRSGISHMNGADNKGNEGNASKGHSEAEARSSGEKQRLTPKQILWLHRNYRGEATFLKAWGLHITRDADRERGREIMQELMAAEVPKEKERAEYDRQHKRRDQQGRLQFNVTPNHAPTDKGGLLAIEEESNNHDGY